MSSILEIQIRIRQRIASFIAQNPGVGNLGFVMTDIIVEEMFGEVSSPVRVISMWNPTSTLPSDPNLYDTYIASATGNGWIMNDIYIYGGEESNWIHVEYLTGRVVYIISEDKLYLAKSSGWVVVGEGGGSISNPLFLTPRHKIEAYFENDDSAHPGLKIEVLPEGGSEWEKLFDSSW